MRVDTGQNMGNAVSNDATYRKRYGNQVQISRLGKITIIHLDSPSEKTIKKRIEEVINEEITGDALEDNCPLCQELRNHPYEVVYDGDSHKM